VAGQQERDQVVAQLGVHRRLAVLPAGLQQHREHVRPVGRLAAPRDLGEQQLVDLRPGRLEAPLRAARPEVRCSAGSSMIRDPRAITRISARSSSSIRAPSSTPKTVRRMIRSVSRCMAPRSGNSTPEGQVATSASACPRMTSP